MVANLKTIAKRIGNFDRPTRYRLAMGGLAAGSLAWFAPAILIAFGGFGSSTARVGVGFTRDSLYQNVFELAYPRRIRKGETAIVALTPGGPAAKIHDLRLFTAKIWGSAISIDPQEFRPIRVSGDGPTGVPGWRWTIRASESGKDYLKVAFMHRGLSDSILALRGAVDEDSSKNPLSKFVLPDTLRPMLLPIIVTNESGLTPAVEFWMKSSGTIAAFVLTLPLLVGWWEKKTAESQRGGVPSHPVQSATEREIEKKPSRSNKRKSRKPRS